MLKTAFSVRFLSLIGLFVLALIVGRLLLDSSELERKKIQQATSTTRIIETKTGFREYKNDGAQVLSQGSCAERLRKEADSNKTEYDSGTVLVGFKEGVTFEAAKNTLGVYGLGVKDAARAKDSYPAKRLLTATGADGREFEKICMLRQDASIRYAGLNVLVPLHE